MKKENLGKLVFSLLFFSSALYAQEDFFSDDFVKNPLTNKKRKDIFDKKDTKIVKEENKKAEKVEESFRSPMLPETEVDLTTQDEAFQKPKKILSIGLIANGMNKEHGRENFSKLLSLVKEHNLPAGDMYYLSTFQDDVMSSDDLITFYVLGGNFELVEEVPEKYQVSKSPTWIVETVDGEVLFEGLLDVGRYINSKGELRVPDGKF